MTEQEILSTVEKAIKVSLNNQSLEIKKESLLINDLGLESIDLLDVSSELEGMIGLEIDFKDVAHYVRTRDQISIQDMKGVKIQDLVSYIGIKKGSFE